MNMHMDLLTRVGADQCATLEGERCLVSVRTVGQRWASRTMHEIIKLLEVLGQPETQTADQVSLGDCEIRRAISGRGLPIEARSLTFTMYFKRRYNTFSEVAYGKGIHIHGDVGSISVL